MSDEQLHWYRLKAMSFGMVVRDMLKMRGSFGGWFGEQQLFTVVESARLAGHFGRLVLDEETKP